MRRYIPELLKQLIIERAGNKCEYCHCPQAGRFITFHVEHIKSVKHGGSTTEDNLALSCPDCNFNKGTDVGTFLDGENLVRFFNPRKDVWGDHFEMKEGAIVPKTDIGRSTVLILQFNTPERIIYRLEVQGL
jgi:hypothetical protein